MDIFAHVLWTSAGARGANESFLKKHRISVAWTAFWGIFPDLFAFSFGFIQLFFYFVLGKISFAAIEADHHIVPGFSSAHTLYQYSHSLIIWAIVFLLIWIIRKRPVYALLGWVLHILIDIPSHSGTFYPTPFLFPLSNYKFLHGVAWSTTWYMIINYSLLLVVFGWMLIRDVRKKRAQKKAQEYLTSSQL